MITFILTCYNRPKELRDLLFSLKMQTVMDFEVIAVDDNSSDPQVEKELIEYFLTMPGGYFKSDVLDENRRNVVRYAENINFVISVADRVAHGDLFAYLCDDVVLDPKYVETVINYFDANPDCRAGFVSEIWEQGGSFVKLLWYNRAMTTAFCALDHSQVIHRREYAVPWPLNIEAWKFADGIAFERLLGMVGTIQAIGDENPLVVNRILETSVCRQPIDDALKKLKENENDAS